MSEAVEVLKLQYERVAQHESNRLVFSNMVILITTAVLAYSGETKFHESPIPFTVMMALLLLINFSALIYIKRSRFWVKHHQERARVILALFLGSIKFAIEKVEKPNSDKDFFRKENLEKINHIGIIMVIVIYLVLAWTCI